MVLKELMVGFLKELIFKVSILGSCGGLEITDFSQFLYLEGMGVLKELIFNMVSHFGQCVVFLKELIFNSFSYWKGVVFLKELILNSVAFGVPWWS